VRQLRPISAPAEEGFTIDATALFASLLRKHFRKYFRKYFQGSLLKMPRRPSAAIAATPHPLISDERIQHLYVTLLRTRLLRQRNRLREAAVPLVAREALVTGTVTHLEDGDVVMPVAGDRLAALARGHALRRVLTGASLPGVLASAIAAEARFAIATGHALAQQGAKHIALAFSGPGIASLNALGPSLAYAAAHKLGIDGNDVVAIYRVAQEAIQRARRGVGPTLIDCKPWLLDDPADPIRRLEQALERRGLPVDKLKERTLTAFRKELSAATQKRK
jgi:hypothetical protein